MGDGLWGTQGTVGRIYGWDGEREGVGPEDAQMTWEGSPGLVW